MELGAFERVTERDPAAQPAPDEPDHGLRLVARLDPPPGPAPDDPPPDEPPAGVPARV